MIPKKLVMDPDCRFSLGNVPPPLPHPKKLMEDPDCRLTLGDVLPSPQIKLGFRVRATLDIQVDLIQIDD